MMYTISQIIEYLDFFPLFFLLLGALLSWWFNERFRDTFCSRIGGNCASTMGIHHRSDSALTVSDFLLPEGWAGRAEPLVGQHWEFGKMKVISCSVSLDLDLSLSLVEGGVRCVRWRSLTSFLFVVVAVFVGTTTCYVQFRLITWKRGKEIRKKR